MKWWTCSLTQWGSSSQRICGISNHNVHFKLLTILFVNYTSTKLGRGGGGTSPRVISLQLCYKMLEYSGKYLKALFIAFISKAQKHRKLWRKEIYIKTPVSHATISFSCPVLNKSFGFPMHLCETMLTNKYWKGSKSKCEHCSTR